MHMSYSEFVLILNKQGRVQPLTLDRKSIIQHTAMNTVTLADGMWFHSGPVMDLLGHLPFLKIELMELFWDDSLITMVVGVELESKDKLK